MPEVRIAAPLERVWAAWTEPDELSRWYPDRVEGRFREGDRIHLAWDALGVSLDLEVAELRPPSRLVLRGAPPGRALQTQVVELREESGATRVRLEHTGFESADERIGTFAGWETQLAVLRHYLERYQGCERASFAALGPAVTGFDRLFAHYTQADQLERWLAGAPASPGAPGEPYALELEPGALVSGEVLARTEGREVALGADEIDGVLALRGFSIDGRDPGVKMLGAIGWSWSSDEEALALVRDAVARAVDRLVAALGGSVASA